MLAEVTTAKYTEVSALTDMRKNDAFATFQRMNKQSASHFIYTETEENTIDFEEDIMKTETK